MNVSAVIDQPLPNSLHDPLCLRVEGWLHAGARHHEIAAIEIRADGKPVAETGIFFERADVQRSLELAPGTRVGFAVLASAPGLFGQSSVRLECHVRFT